MGDSSQDLERLADQLAPHIVQKLANTPSVWGDKTRLYIGVNVHLVNTLFNLSSGDIYLGDNVFFGHNVCLLTGTHDVSCFGVERQTAYPRTGRDIVIGRGAWVASNATVIGPCTIGENAVVAAGSLLLRDVPDGWIAAGSPAVLIRPVSPEYATTEKPSLLRRLLRWIGRHRFPM
ncbi:acyltransferase [Roseomonas nepalensis]|uniref:Acyltransferase n=1 Tax=Muricoccus nepalensis TaxID=1854500 RepID=A0A502FAM1_9PROT|nr:acyltransferase [Roseomonas nepalensis]